MKSTFKTGGLGGQALLPQLLFLCVLVVLVFSPALSAYFEADDFLWLIHASWHDGTQALTGNWGLGVAWRPITRLSFLLDARLFGWNAWPWHAVNLGLHALNAVLLAVLAGQAGAARRDALLAAALFAVLPLDWENVDWISGRTGSLCLSFLLGAAIFWFRARLWPACLCQALALLCYEPAVILPLALLALVPVAGADAPARRRLLAGIAALAGTAAAIWLLRWLLLGSAKLATDVTGRHYFPTLGFDVLSLGAHAWRDFGAIGFIAVAILLGRGLYSRRCHLGVACLLAACAALYLPFTPVAGFTERFAYLATAPLACALALSASSWRGGRVALCMLAVLFAIRSHAQAEGFARAGDLTRAMLAAITAIPDTGSNLVFDGVPTHDGPYYLLWANFEDSVAALRPSAHFAATSEWVLRMPDLLRRTATEATRYYEFDAATRGFRPLPAVQWRARHGVASP